MAGWANHGQLEQWRAPFCGCFDDCGSCLMSFFFPCGQYASNAVRIDGSSWCGACCLYCICWYEGCCCLVHSGKRTALRYNYGLAESCCCDCFVTWALPCCALSQECRELNIRGPPPPRQTMSGSASPTTIVINNSNPNNPQSPMHMGYAGQQQQQYIMGTNGQMIPVQQQIYPSYGQQQSPMSPQGVQMQQMQGPYSTSPMHLVQSTTMPEPVGTYTDTVHNYGEGQAAPSGSTMVSTTTP